VNVRPNEGVTEKGLMDKGEKEKTEAKGGESV